MAIIVARRGQRSEVEEEKKRREKESTMNLTFRAGHMNERIRNELCYNRHLFCQLSQN
jgi:hypothetical protein